MAAVEYSILDILTLILRHSHAHIRHSLVRGLFPNVKEACSTAALLRTLRHRTPTSTVPMLRTLERRAIFASFVFENSEVFQGCIAADEPKLPTILCVHWAGSWKWQSSTRSNSEVILAFRNILCRIAFYRFIMLMQIIKPKDLCHFSNVFAT